MHMGCRARYDMGCGTLWNGARERAVRHGYARHMRKQAHDSNTRGIAMGINADRLAGVGSKQCGTETNTTDAPTYEYVCGKFTRRLEVPHTELVIVTSIARHWFYRKQ